MASSRTIRWILLSILTMSTFFIQSADWGWKHEDGGDGARGRTCIWAYPWSQANSCPDILQGCSVDQERVSQLESSKKTSQTSTSNIKQTYVGWGMLDDLRSSNQFIETIVSARIKPRDKCFEVRSSRKGREVWSLDRYYSYHVGNHFIRMRVENDSNQYSCQNTK